LLRINKKERIFSILGEGDRNVRDRAARETWERTPMNGVGVVMGEERAGGGGGSL